MQSAGRRFRRHGIPKLKTYSFDLPSGVRAKRKKANKRALKQRKINQK